ncbi:MAG: SUMF1/EgtB/PvdO family nonheme iron enzyme [Cyclobacteriaceae bacterium]
MNKYWLTICIACSLFANAMGLGEIVPEKIYLKTQVIRTQAWYEEQAELWEEQLQINPRDAQGWLNFYTAAYYAKAPTWELTDILETMKTMIPDTFEYHYVLGWNAGSREDEHLLKAYALSPKNPLTYGRLMRYYEKRQDTDKMKQFGEKLLQSKFISTGLINYSYNVLMSTEQNGILITEGENTTLPLWLLQHGMDIRKDVVILNLDLLADTKYRNQKLLLHQLTAPAESLISETVIQTKKRICTELPMANPDHKFYFALTLPKENIDGIDGKLYVVGLASQLSEQPINNLALLKKNVRQRFLMDYLTVDFNGEPKYTTGRVLNANYLVPLLMLYDHYSSSGQTPESDELEVLIDKLAIEGNKETQVSNYLRKDVQAQNTKSFAQYSLEIKELDKSLKLIKGNLYAQDREVTNGQYNAFLNYLKENSLNDLYQICKVDLSKYNEPALSLMKSYHFPRELLAGKPAKKKKNSFKEYPVINISYNAAVKYCEWLTHQYNRDVDRKFKKAKFRLPEFKEWQVAALGYPQFPSWNIKENVVEAGASNNRRKTKAYDLKDYEVKYPWWYFDFELRNRISNQFDCYLANVKVPDTTKVACPPNPIGGDGFMMTSLCGAYFPNGLELYDMVGNVAEMLNEQGKACGGSWNHLPEESTISSITEYSGPEATIGFRVFMEVIEQ